MESRLDVSELISYSKGGILSKVISKDEDFDVTLFSMAAGTEIGEHTSSMAGVLYVLEGKGTFTLEGDELEMKKGVLIRIPASALHELKAVEDTSFLLVLNKKTK